MNSQEKDMKQELFNCFQGMKFAEMMQKMRGQESGCCGFDRSEMMQKMMTMYCRPGKEKEEPTEEG